MNNAKFDGSQVTLVYRRRRRCCSTWAGAVSVAVIVSARVPELALADHILDEIALAFISKVKSFYVYSRDQR